MSDKNLLQLTHSFADPMYPKAALQLDEVAPLITVSPSTTYTTIEKYSKQYIYLRQGKGLRTELEKWFPSHSSERA